MKFKKHNWMKYGRQGEIIEITIRDSTNSKLDFFKCNNQEDYAKILRIINSKYGFGFKQEFKRKEQMNFRDQVEEEREFLEKERVL